MKKMMLILTLCVGLFSCNNNQTKNTDTDSACCAPSGCTTCPSECCEQNVTKGDVVEILYFHNKQRCATCMAIEKNTKELIDSAFADKIKSGDLVFKTVDIAENETLADKYEITFSSLVLVDYNSEKEIAENLTEFAFANARKNPDKFKAELKTKLEALLNN